MSWCSQKKKLPISILGSRNLCQPKMTFADTSGVSGRIPKEWFTSRPGEKTRRTGNKLYSLGHHRRIELFNWFKRDRATGKSLSTPSSTKTMECETRAPFFDLTCLDHGRFGSISMEMLRVSGPMGKFLCPRCGSKLLLQHTNIVTGFSTTLSPTQLNLRIGTERWPIA